MLGNILSLAVSVLVLSTTQVTALWPAPRSLSTGTTFLRLDPNFAINAEFPGAPTDLDAAISRTLTHLKTDNLERLIVGRGASNQSAISSSKHIGALNLHLVPGAKVNPIATEAVKDLTTRNEAYSLTVPADGSAATLTANTTLGLLRGLTTFEQLFFTLGSDIYTFEAPISIIDAPAFPYRGFLLDTARNFFPVSDILRVLDTMSSAKLNVFHWHIVDSQSFPLDVPAFPELAQQGAYSSSMTYPRADIQKIVAYAAERGVDIMVEIDTPGHEAAIVNSHPEFIACADERPWASFANEPPAGQLRFADPTVVTFVQELFTSVASLFPSTLFSTGGDELNTNCYAQDAPTQASLKASGQTLEQALNVFVEDTHASLIKAGKTPVVWEEMVLVQNVTLHPDTIALVWISSDDVGAVAAKGFRLVHAASDFFYLDCGGGGWVGNAPGLNSWCDPLKTWQDIYIFDPYEGVTTAQQPLVLGGQALLWTEQTDPSNLDSIAFPRGLVQGEIFWTGATLPSGAARNVEDALPRLHEQRFRLVNRGVRAIPLQPLWCALRDGICDLTA